MCGMLVSVHVHASALYQLMTATWLTVKVWFAGLQINRSASETSQCHSAGAGTCSYWNTGTFSLCILARHHGKEKLLKF